MIGSVLPPPGPNSHSRCEMPDTGSLCSLVRKNRMIGKPVGLLGRAGKVNPLLAVSSNEPIVTRVTSLVTSKLVWTPLKVSVAVLAPDPIVMEFVPSPLHTMFDLQSNVPLVDTVVDVTKNGSAPASETANRESARTDNPSGTARLMSDPSCSADMDSL